MATFDFTLEFYNPVIEELFTIEKSVEFNGTEDKIVFNQVGTAPAGFLLTGVTKKGRIYTGSHYKVLKECVLTVKKEE